MTITRVRQSIPGIPDIPLADPSLLKGGLATERGDGHERVEKAAEDFEGLLLQQMFDAMWSSVPEGGLLSGGREAEFYRDLLNQELSKEIAHTQSIGLKKAFADDMRRIEGNTAPSSRRLGVA